MEKYKFLSHTADIKFQAFGKTMEKCFENAGYALAEIMYERTKIKAVEKKNIEIKGRDNISLLNNFLQEFLFLLDAENFAVSKIKINKIENMGGKFILKAELMGDNLAEKKYFSPNSPSPKKPKGLEEVQNYKFSNSAKAITYNDMWIKIPSKDGGNRFVCQVVVDV